MSRPHNCLHVLHPVQGVRWLNPALASDKTRTLHSCRSA